MFCPAGEAAGLHTCQCRHESSGHRGRQAGIQAGSDFGVRGHRRQELLQLMPQETSACASLSASSAPPSACWCRHLPCCMHSCRSTRAAHSRLGGSRLHQRCYEVSKQAGGVPLCRHSRGEMLMVWFLAGRKRYGLCWAPEENMTSSLNLAWSSTGTLRTCSGLCPARYPSAQGLQLHMPSGSAGAPGVMLRKPAEVWRRTACSRTCGTRCGSCSPAQRCRAAAAWPLG